MEKELIVKWKIRESETPKILKLLPEMVEKTRNEKGCVFYYVYRSVDNANELILHERYADEAALEAHRNTEHYLKIVAEQIRPYLEGREVVFVEKLF